MITSQQLESVASRIAQLINPKFVILFGSQARGTAVDHSDLDLLIVNEPPNTSAWSRRREIGRIRRCIPALGIPVDVVLFTPEEVDRWKDTTNHIVSEAYKEGKLLYERP